MPDFLKTLLLLQLLFDHSEIFTGETSTQCHPITKSEFQISAQNSRNCRNIAEITDFFFKTLLLLQFLFDHSEIFTEETRHIVPPYNQAKDLKFLLRIPEIAEIPDFFKTLLLLEFSFDHSGNFYWRNQAYSATL